MDMSENTEQQANQTIEVSNINVLTKELQAVLLLC